MAEAIEEMRPPQSLKELIERFIVEDQLKSKLENLDKDIAKKQAAGEVKDVLKLEEKRTKTLAEHIPRNWIEDASRRAGQLTIVSHAVKYANPDAKGTQVLFDEQPKRPAWLIGTHSLGTSRNDDIVGNAAALDVYKFLKLSFAGKTVLQHVRDESPELIAAMAVDADLARSWIHGLAQILKDNTALSSHPLSKQLYYPVGGQESYHLLAPLFPTSLVHELMDHLSADLFGDDVKAAREALKAGQNCDHGYVDYPDLAIQTFGGSKPRNISRLNSERRGEAWLLPSLPPTWRSQGLRAPLFVESVFGAKILRGARHVDALISTLVDFLLKVSDYNNVNIRNKRADLVSQVIDEVLLFGWERQEALEPGWSAGADCRLVEVERLWLDPGRAVSDPDFAAKLEAGDWQAELAQRFAAWFNSQLRRHSRKKHELSVGADEQAKWAKELREALKMQSWEVNHD